MVLFVISRVGSCNTKTARFESKGRSSSLLTDKIIPEDSVQRYMLTRLNRGSPAENGLNRSTSGKFLKHPIAGYSTSPVYSRAENRFALSGDSAINCSSMQ